MQIYAALIFLSLTSLFALFLGGIRPPLEAYDVLIHLDSKQVPLLAKAVDPPANTFQARHL